MATSKSSDMNCSIEHPTLQATLNGTRTVFDNVEIDHYRGIKYAHIARRFAQSKPIGSHGGSILDCSRFGPSCPQNYVEVEHLLRIPKTVGAEFILEQDEFDCLNINVSIPAHTGVAKLLPVLIWIYGGSQVVCFPPTSHKASDTSPPLAQAVKIGKPYIFVTFNYRLNIFSFGNGSEVNLGLKDQRLAIEWVTKHIAGFGGDKNNITLCGESAGGVYCHAHLATGAPIRRGILQSGSLYLSPPLLLTRGDSLIAKFSEGLKQRTGFSMEDAPVAEILQQLKNDKINTMWIQLEQDFEGWELRIKDLPDLIIGDTEFESIIWRNGVERLTSQEIDATFNIPDNIEVSNALKAAYHIAESNETASRNGVLDFLTDARFAKPVNDIVSERRHGKRKTFRYLFDQPSPFQTSSRAHHAVEILYLFGAYSEIFSTPGQRRVAAELSQRWAQFVNGEAPWNEEKIFAFGPVGQCSEITDSEVEERRRTEAWNILDTVSLNELNRVFGSLAGGRISLLN